MTTWFVDDHGNFENLEIIFLCWSTQPPVIESLKPKNMTIDTYRSCHFETSHATSKPGIMSNNL